MAQELSEQQHEEEIGEAALPEVAGKRERSTIQFPYLSLEDAVVIAKGVHEVGGNRCQVDQLAAHLNVKPDTGAFRVRLGTAKMFGLTTYSSGTVTLTSLGSRICDPQQEQAAKAESFLVIPLYQKVYEQFKGVNLPQLAALETAMVNMGVSPKQKDTARQVFQRSAQYADFFWSGPGRLVYPRIKGSSAGAPAAEHSAAPEEDKEQDRPGRKKGNGNGGDGGGEYHPFITGLLTTLPPADSDWPMDARRKWLQAASHIFEVIYKDSESKGSLRIEVQKDSTR